VDNDIHVAIRSASGAAVNSFSVDSSAADDENASVAEMKNGNFVVAWDRADGSSTAGYFATYGADGSARVAPHVFDFQGADNAHMSVTALAKGGFAVAYVDSGWNGSDNISVEVFKANGNFVNAVEVSPGDGPAAADSEPALTQLQDGTLAVSWTHVINPTDTDIYLQLLDSKTGQLLLSEPEKVADTSAQDFQSSVAALGGGQVLVTYLSSDGGAHGAYMQLEIERDGSDGKDHIIGSGAVDTINGYGASDLLKGGDGDDIIFGGDGKDIINGQDGFDVLTGGAGKDTFQFSSIDDISRTDEITDLEAGDNINLKGIDANSLVAGDQAFTIVAAFTGHAGQLTIEYDAGKDTTYVTMDVDGDGQADGTINIDGDHRTFNHFVL
jgi:hypothetical protein